MRSSTRRWFTPLLILAGAVGLSQCTEQGLVAPDAAEPAVEAPVVGAAVPGMTSVVCRAVVRTGSVSCAADRPDGGEAPQTAGGATAEASGSIAAVDPAAKIIGQQGQYVQLASSNIVVDAGVFSFDVTVQNLIAQSIGTFDGAAPVAEGVRVFFHQLPTVTEGTGSITVANEDGLDTFTATDQPFYQYDGVLATNQTSAAKNWQFAFADVDAFEFKVYVWAPMQFPGGFVSVTPDTGFLVEGGTLGLTATVRDFAGTAVINQSGIAFGSSATGVATVDGAGLVSAAEPGTVTITATRGELSGSATLSVCPNLAVGETYTAEFPGAASVCFHGGVAGSAAEYTYVPVNLSSSSSLSLTLTGSGIVAVTGPPTPGPVASELQLTPQEKLARDERFHAEMLLADAHIARTVAGSGRISSQKGSLAAGIPTGVPAVGDLWTLSVALGCSGTPDLRTGRVVSVSSRAIIVSDTTNPPGGFTTAQYDSIGLEFDSIAYPSLANNFGTPTDLDGNGRAVIFYTRAVNELSPPASSVVVSGYFTARDLFSAAPESCPLSNEGEMFYMLVPDPTGVVNSNVRTVAFVRGQTVGTTGHEFQHLINASRRLYVVGTSNLEEVWLNEGMSHIGEELMFYRTSVGLGPRQNIVVSNLTTGPNASRRVAAFNTYANQNYGRMRSWLQRPDTTGPLKNVDALASRGAVWGLLRYAADRLNGTDSTFWSSLISAQTGKANLSSALGGANVDTWTRDFIMAMYADDAVAGIGTEYTQPSWSFRSLYGALNGSYQLVPRPLTNGVGLTLSYSRGAGSAFARFGVPASGFATVTALSGGGIPATPYNLIVMRTK